MSISSGSQFTSNHRYKFYW